MELVIVGCQSGDEGKGKFTDIFSRGAYAVVRYQAGPHTGHTVVTDDGEFRFVQIPAGALRGAVGVLGNGCVVDPRKLVTELDALERAVGDVPLLISDVAHVVMPYHLLQDEAFEAFRGDAVATSPQTGFATGVGQVGSTKQGVGPCREDKIARIGLRMVDLLDRDVLAARLGRIVPLKRALLERVYAASADELERELDVARLVDEYHAYGRRLEPVLGDVSLFLAESRRHDRYVVYEGAQGFALDVEHGTYPYCSSGYSAASGVTVGTGSPPTRAFRVVGVAKAYMVQVGGGPLVTELAGDLADHLVERGREVGTVTGRRRRVGWLDLCFVRKSVRVDGVQHLCLTNLDVLAGLPEVKVATHYLLDGEPVDEYPVRLPHAARVEPVYETFPGWPESDWLEIARAGYDALPGEARAYVEFVAETLDVAVAAVSIGRSRAHTIVLESLVGEPSPTA